MNRKLFQLAIVMMWLALPLTAMNYRRNWDRLPVRMAVHFDINWQPNGWTSPEMSLRLALGITALMLIVFTIAALAISRVRVSNLAVWPMVAFFYAVLGFVLFVNNWVVERNLRDARPTPQAQSTIFCDPDSAATFARQARFLRLHS